MRTLEEALASAVRTPDEADGRVYGWILGKVTDIDAKLMRIKARVGKQEDGDSTDWLTGCFDGSTEGLPEIGDPVAVDFVDGDPHRGRWAYFPQSTTNGRPTESMVLGSTLIAMYNDLATKLNNLLAHYQAFYAFVQGHGHTSFGTPSPQMTVLLMDPTAKDTSTSTGLGQASDGSVVSSNSSNNKVLSKRGKVR